MNEEDYTLDPGVRAPSSLSLHKAASAWGQTETSGIEMDPRLAYAFAIILDEAWSTKPWLGNATTKELLEELEARCSHNGGLSYRTVDKR